MKKIFLLFLLSFSIATINAQIINPNSEITYETLSDGEEKTAILNYINNHEDLFRNLMDGENNVLFDFNNLKMLNVDGIWTKHVICYEIVNNESVYRNLGNHSELRTLVFNFDEKNLVSHFISKTSFNNTDKNLKMYDGNFNLLFTVNILENDEVEVMATENLLSRGSCSQKTLDCINHHYQKRGWFSVGLTVLSAFYPGVTVAVAASCGVTCCLNIGCTN